MVRKNVLYMLIGWTAFLILAAGVCAQEAEYRFGPRDVISLEVIAGGESQQTARMTVNAAGEIDVPFVGRVQAQGLSVKELQEKIRAPLAAEYFVAPEVIIHILEYHSIYFYITGAINSPGLYETSSQISLMQLIAKAGGVKPTRANEAFILRNAAKHVQDGEKVEDLISGSAKEKVDLEKLLENVDMRYNPVLKSGDVVYIPEKEETDIEEEKPSVYVEGEVKQPGVYSFYSGMTALNACIMAGGFTKYAAPNRARIIRNKEIRPDVIPIDLEDVKRGRISDIELQPGDVINIPESWL